jgi:DNA-binding response OmpR family regulator
VLADMTFSSVPVFDICKKIKASFDIPVVFVSSVDDNDERLAAYNSGADVATLKLSFMIA